jgi:hypothetical protein
MPKNKEKPKLPKASEVPAVKPLLEDLEKRKAVVAKAKAKATKDGKLNKYDPKYRDAVRRLKKTCRHIRKEIIRHLPKEAPKKAEGAPAGQVKPAEVKPAEVKPAEVKPAEVKPAEVKPAEVKPAEVKPAEVKPAEVKPAEVKPAEVKPAEAKPAEAPKA